MKSIRHWHPAAIIAVACGGGLAILIGLSAILGGVFHLGAEDPQSQDVSAIATATDPPISNERQAELAYFDPIRAGKWVLYTTPVVALDAAHEPELSHKFDVLEANVPPYLMSAAGSEWSNAHTSTAWEDYKLKSAQCEVWKRLTLAPASKAIVDRSGSITDEEIGAIKTATETAAPPGCLPQQYNLSIWSTADLAVSRVRTPPAEVAPASPGGPLPDVDLPNVNVDIDVSWYCIRHPIRCATH